MKGFIPKEKLGKKARRELDREQRQTWAINPISRKCRSAKVYDRKKTRFPSDDGAGSFKGVLQQNLASIAQSHCENQK